MTVRPASTTRRQLLRSSAALAVLPAAGIRCAAARTATPAAPATPAACLETPMMSMGPYFLDGMPIRRDITEGRPGVPLTLALQITSLDGCAPIANVAVDLWHCDAKGSYSGVDGSDGIFMRGVQLTGADGKAVFETLYPGWYPGRTPHLHVMARTGATEENGAVTGGIPLFVGQLFLDDTLTDRIYAMPPYDSRNNGERTRNDSDGIFMREPKRALLIVRIEDFRSGTPSPPNGLEAEATLAIASAG